MELSFPITISIRLFFEQLKALQPDLIIVSLGTNESFAKMKSEEYMKQLQLFLTKCKSSKSKC